MAEPQKPGQLEGFFLTFTSEEIEEVKKFLAEEEYEANASGMKEFLMDCMFEEGPSAEENATERLIHKARGYINNNPDPIRAGVNIAFNIMELLKNKK